MKRTMMIVGMTTPTALGIAAIASGLRERKVQIEQAEPTEPAVQRGDVMGRSSPSVGTIAGLMMGMGGMSLPRPKPPRELTDFDRTQMDLAQEKRERKQRARAKR